MISLQVTDIFIETFWIKGLGSPCACSCWPREEQVIRSFEYFCDGIAAVLTVLCSKFEFCWYFPSIHSFLSKIYCLSSVEAFQQFRHNPRRFLKSPMPKPPCKISVLGGPLAGKTSLCAELAERFDAQVRTACLCAN